MTVAAWLGVAVVLAASVANAATVRLCVPESAMGPCAEMQAALAMDSAKPSVQCVAGPDTYGCLQKVVAGEADVTGATGEDMFMASELYDRTLQVVVETRDWDKGHEPWRYEGVAVVRRSSISSLNDLIAGKVKSCHTGYERTAGWNIPFSHLLEKGLIQMHCDQDSTVVEHDVKAASVFFKSACLPGPWAPDNETDYRLKQKYNNLCSLCSTPGQCLNEDLYSGYLGALDCLVRGGGDIAWTKMSAVKEYMATKRTLTTADYRILCPDGREMPVSTDTSPCVSWATRPWNGWLVRSDNGNKARIHPTLTALMDAAALRGGKVKSWATPVLGIKKASIAFARYPPLSTLDYLREHKYDVTIDRLGCQEVPVKLCVSSKPEMDKCEALRVVLKSRRIRPGLQCVSPAAPQDCLGMVANGGAHITTADGGDVYRAHVEHKLVPLVSERYGLQDASYFAVAVVKANSGITSLSQLRGKKSCHTGIGRTAGWKIPVVTLMKAGLLEENNCDFAQQIGNFFSSSCVPGAKDPQYDPQGTNPQNLCALCVGNNGEKKCDRGPSEAYSGYTGAFRCLVEGGGDVAFVKQITVRDNTNGNNNASWAANLRATDFKLLCLNTGTADVVDYNTCHLARVPAHKVLMSSSLSPVMQEEARILLLRASEELPQGQDVFHMFGTFDGKQDLIFKDSATALVNVRNDTFHNSLEDRYYETLAQMDACKTQGTSMHLTDAASSLPLAPAHLLITLIITWLLAH